SPPDPRPVLLLGLDHARRRRPGPRLPGRRCPLWTRCSQGTLRSQQAQCSLVRCAAPTPGVLLGAQARHRRQARRPAACALAVGRASTSIHLGADAELLLDLLLNPVGQVRVVAQEVPGVLLALAELVAVVGVPGAGLAHDALLDAEVNKAALAANSLPVQD